MTSFLLIFYLNYEDYIVSQQFALFVGDLFESEEDIADENLWLEVSENPEKQRENRAKVLSIADHIIPGHGKLFKVTQEMRDSCKLSLQETATGKEEQQH